MKAKLLGYYRGDKMTGNKAASDCMAWLSSTVDKLEREKTELELKLFECQVKK